MCFSGSLWLIVPIFWLIVAHCANFLAHCGSLCQFTGSLWVIVCFSGSLWLIVCFSGSLWVIVGHCGSLWLIVYISDTHIQWKPSLLPSLDNTKMTRNLHCSTGFHQNLQIMLLTAYQLMCSAQAYRCRKLPDFMNEAMSLFYTFLITSVSFGVSFPMSYFRRQPVDREFIGVIILLINCYVTLLLMYVKKCYIMIWQPKKNSKEYFNKKRMEHVGVNYLAAA